MALRLRPSAGAAVRASRVCRDASASTTVAVPRGLRVVPLVVGQGAGAEMRRTLGMAVFAGMLGVTLFGIFLTPVFFDVIQRLVDTRERRRRGTGF